MPVTTLTLHHILPYLPFGLEFEIYKHVDTIPTWVKDKLGTLSDECIVFKKEADWYFNYDENETDAKPLLYSLDDYKSVIACQAIIPDLRCIDILNLAKGHITPEQCSYAAIQAMAEAHIDMFRLCDAGLAVKKD